MARAALRRPALRAELCCAIVRRTSRRTADYEILLYHSGTPPPPPPCTQFRAAAAASAEARVTFTQFPFARYHCYCVCVFVSRWLSFVYTSTTVLASTAATGRRPTAGRRPAATAVLLCNFPHRIESLRRAARSACYVKCAARFGLPPTCPACGRLAKGRRPPLFLAAVAQTASQFLKGRRRTIVCLRSRLCENRFAPGSGGGTLCSKAPAYSHEYRST